MQISLTIQHIYIGQDIISYHMTHQLSPSSIKEVQSMMSKLPTESLMPHRRQTLPVLSSNRIKSTPRTTVLIPKRTSPGKNDADNVQGDGIKLSKRLLRPPSRQGEAYISEALITAKKGSPASLESDDTQVRMEPRKELYVTPCCSPMGENDTPAPYSDITAFSPTLSTDKINPGHFFSHVTNFTFDSDMNDTEFDTDDSSGERIAPARQYERNFNNINESRNPYEIKVKAQFLSPHVAASESDTENQAIKGKLQFPNLYMNRNLSNSNSETVLLSPRANIAQLENEISDIELMFGRVQEAMLRGNIRNRILVYSSNESRDQVGNLLPSL